MAQVPREAVEFARMLVRAFYPPEFVVITDAVLRHNNYCAHHDLARHLKMQPKELRQILVRMVYARLMSNEKRQQKRINLRDDRRPTRLVNTEFWYVPLVEVVDAFVFRVHKLTKDIETKRSNELAAQNYVCERCKSEYQLLEILSEMTPQGDFVCTRMGVRPDRRPLPCGGIIREQDNSKQIKETERILQKLHDELHPLRTRADQCSRMEIPAHPLEGADEETWGELVPETVGIHGEAVDEDGLDKELSAKLNHNQPGGKARQDMDSVVPQGEVKDDAPVPEKPTWFRDMSKDADEAEDDWVNEQTGGNILEAEKGTAASFFAEEDEKLYYERYLKEMSGESASVEQPQVHNADAIVASQTVEVVDVDAEAPGSNQEAARRADAIEDEVDELENVMVSVAGKQMKLSEVTEEMTEKMTADEYKAYFALAQGGGGDGGDDEDEDDFE